MLEIRELAALYARFLRQYSSYPDPFDNPMYLPLGPGPVCDGVHRHMVSRAP